jgi:hypothetical protein
MNADDRANQSTGRMFSPVTDDAAQQAAAAQAPTSGAIPTSGTVPQRTALRPSAAASSSAQYSTRQAAPAAQPTSGAVPTTGAHSTTAAHPNTAPTQTMPAGASFTAGAAGAVGVGVDKLKEYATRAKESLTEGDDMHASGKGGPRKARVLLSRIDPWSALKMGFLLSIAAGIMLVVAVFVLWSTLNQMGVFVTVNDWILDLFTVDQEVDLLQFTSLSKVMSATILLSIINVVLLTALTTIGAFLYNTVSSVVGGVYVTLTDD